RGRAEERVPHLVLLAGRHELGRPLTEAVGALDATEVAAQLREHPRWVGAAHADERLVADEEEAELVLGGRRTGRRARAGGAGRARGARGAGSPGRPGGARRAG